MNSHHTIDLSQPIPPLRQGHLNMGSTDPSGREINANNRFLTVDDAPWLPVMGEFHYTRCPADEWETELLKIKSGGVSIVATYLFWIHHEEEEDQFEFTGQRDLGRFVRLCQKHGLWVWLRIGPWAHGECRNGGFPDWLQAKGIRLRDNQPAFMKLVRRYWEQVYRQVQGLFYAEGGPVIGIQVENELMVNAPYLLALKQMAQEIGFRVPLYTATGWGEVHIPEDELLPIYGGYADGFWERDITEWSVRYRGQFFFRHTRNDTTIGNDLYRASSTEDQIDATRYPFATCEMGGGMPSAYHRRPLIAPEDTEALSYVMVGSGSNLQGYYMYHGGANPEGKMTTLQESQATGYPNDLPLITYFPDSPLGEFGQANPAYHLLRPLHLFLADFGPELAPLLSTLPDQKPSSLLDRETLRWAVRHNNHSGFLFVNNHQRREPLPTFKGVQFSLCLTVGKFLFPTTPVSIPSGSCFVWPFNWSLSGLLLRYATAQPLCRTSVAGIEHILFFAQEGIPTEFVFASESVDAVSVTGGTVTDGEGSIRITISAPGTNCVVRLQSKEGREIHLVVLNRQQALQCYKVRLPDREYIVLSPSVVVTEEKSVHLYSRVAEDMWFSTLPTLPKISSSTSEPDGIFTCYKASVPDVTIPVFCEKLQEASPTPPVRIGPAGVAQTPEECAYERAGIWRISVPPQAMEGLHNLFLRIRYIGDAARAYCGDTLLTDHFYNGSVWEIGLKRFGESVLRDGIEIRILPLRKDAPFYLEPGVWPNFPAEGEVAELLHVEAVPEYERIRK